MRPCSQYFWLSFCLTVGFCTFALSDICRAEDQSIKSLTLDSAISIAFNSNLQRRIIKTDITVAQDKTAQASSAFGPELTLEGGYYHYNEEPAMAQIGKGLIELNNGLSVLTGGQTPRMAVPNDSLNYYGFQISITQPLYTGNKLTAAKKQAEANEESAEANLAVSDNDLVFAVKRAYFTVGLCRQLLSTMDEAVASMEDHVKEAEGYYRANVVPKLDVLRAQERLAELKQKQLSARNNVVLAERLLNYNMGVDLDTEYSIDCEMKYTPLAMDLDRCRSEALSSRPELGAINAKIEMARQGVTIAESVNKPTVALVADRHNYRPENDAPSTRVGVVATFKLFDNGMTKNKVKEAEDRLRQTETGKEQLLQGIMLEVEQSYRNAESSLKTIDVSQKNIDTAQEALRAAKARYNVGLSTSLERLDAELAMTQAKTSYIQALSMYNIAMAELDRAIGKGTEQIVKSDPIR
jgi:outer membrane protein